MEIVKYITKIVEYKFQMLAEANIQPRANSHLKSKKNVQNIIG